MPLETYKDSKPFQIVPDSLSQAIQFAKIIASSDLAPKEYKNKFENCLIAMQMGAEVGLLPMQSIQNIAVINGRPCVWGDAMLALVRASSDFGSIKEWSEGELANGSYIAICEVNNNRGETVKRQFSVVDAKRASLLNKSGPWQQYPERMFQMRARGFACRDLFPHILKGLNSAEETIDIPQTDYTVMENKKTIKLNKPVIIDKNDENSSYIQYDEIKYIIETAENMEDMKVAADLSKELQEDKKCEIREIYKEKLLKLKESAL